jgi:hypothetical protein
VCLAWENPEEGSRGDPGNPPAIAANTQSRGAKSHRLPSSVVVIIRPCPDSYWPVRWRCC